MEKCPYCGSVDVYYSKKRKIFVCEDCDETFDELKMTESTSNDNGNTGLNLFFSYGHDRNRTLVERIKRDLEKRGHHVWIDTNEIKAGDNWRNDILNGVLKASNVIAFLSEHSTRNPGVCLDELKIAVCIKGANIKTVLLEPENRISQPATLSDIQWLDMSEWSDIRLKSEEEFEIWYQSKLDELCHAIESTNSFELNGDINALKVALSPYLNTEKEYRLLAKEFYGRKWLEEYIEDWQDRHSNKSLVIYGNPGTGKSAFCVTYSHYNSDVYGCFLCEWNREYSIKPNQLIRTMAFRLATKLPDYRRLLLNQLEQIDGKLVEMSDDALFEFLLSYPLNHLVDGGRETGIIIVDGLDEAEIDGINPLATVFARCVERLPRWIKFVFTARPEKNIIALFENAISLDLVSDMPEGYNDIMAYLLHALSSELKQIPNRLEVLNKVCELSEGIFLYAELFVEDVKNGGIDLRDTDKFPRGLSDFYRLSMQRKFSDNGSFEKIRDFVEILSVSDNIPEALLIDACNYSKYTYFSYLDKMGSWINRHVEKQKTIGFSHKSLADWFTNETRSGEYFVDKCHGALVLARQCRKLIDKIEGMTSGIIDELQSYAKERIGTFYVLSKRFDELELFLQQYANTMNPYWSVWNLFPETWNHSVLLKTFWESPNRNEYALKLQREGNTSLLIWIFNLAKEQYGVEQFDQYLVSIYIDIVHMSGDYAGAVEIASSFLQGHSQNEIEENEFLAMMRVRKIHHSMFYKPVRKLIEESLSIYALMDERYPKVMNELLFLIGGNLGVLDGKWDSVYEWLKKSEDFAQRYNLIDYSKRNARKFADYYCHKGDYDLAMKIIHNYAKPDEAIEGRYENYLIGALANIYTCMGDFDEALQCYDAVLQYSAAKGIVGWAAHANLGIANVNYKLGNLKEAVEFALRANGMYKQIKQEWGVIMSGVLLSACESRFGIAPMKVACKESLDLAQKLQYGSCVEAIDIFCNSHDDYLKLYFL